MKINEIYEAPKCESFDLNLEQLVCASGTDIHGSFTYKEDDEDYNW